MEAVRICYFSGSHGDWGGASRVFFTNLRLLDRSRFEPIVLLPAHGPAEKILDDLAIPHQVWGMLQEPGNLLRYFKAFLRAVLWYRKERVQLVHMNRANDWRPAELLAAKFCRIPIITHFHTVNHDRAPATAMASAIAAVSDFVARESHTLGVPVTVIHNAVNIKRFSGGRNIRNYLGLVDKQVIVTFVGQIRGIKGVEDFIEMAKRVRGEEVGFLVAGQCRNQPGIGDALSKEQLEALIAGDARIHYCGYQSNIEDVYHSSDIVVVPSRWEEPFGLVLIEAAAAGKPVVATRVGGIPEVVRDGIWGCLVDKGDVESLASRVQLLVENPLMREEFSKAALKHAEQEFTKNPVRKLEQLYSSLLSPKEIG